MYAGHVGIALGLRAPRGAPPLWLLVLAAQGPDWGDVACFALGLPRDDVWWRPHGLIPMAVGAALAAWLGARITGGRRAALLAGAAYLTHWPADFLTGIKPTWPGGPHVGLGLYGAPATDLALEAAVIVAGWLVWCASLPEPRRDRRRAAVVLGVLGALLVLQAAADRAMALGLG